jgi:hypothetical protein
MLDVVLPVNIEPSDALPVFSSGYTVEVKYLYLCALYEDLFYDRYIVLVGGGMADPRETDNDGYY